MWRKVSHSLTLGTNKLFLAFCAEFFSGVVLVSVISFFEIKRKAPGDYKLVIYSTERKMFHFGRLCGLIRSTTRYMSTFSFNLLRDIFYIFDKFYSAMALIWILRKGQTLCRHLMGECERKKICARELCLAFRGSRLEEISWFEMSLSTNGIKCIIISLINGSLWDVVWPKFAALFKTFSLLKNANKAACLLMLFP